MQAATRYCVSWLKQSLAATGKFLITAENCITMLYRKKQETAYSKNRLRVRNKNMKEILPYETLAYDRPQLERSHLGSNVKLSDKAAINSFAVECARNRAVP